jgi:tetratricopeptide (TPR) repeat protein
MANLQRQAKVCPTWAGSGNLKVMRWRIALGVLMVFALAEVASARDRWICLRSNNFELYTTSDEKIGREALRFFEQIRRAFTEILGVKLPENKPATIIAFHDEQAFAPYRPQGNVLAYTMTISGHEYILMQDLVPEHYPVALHEYTHVVIGQAGIKLPLWLNEGFAEFYATLTPVGGKIRVGRMIPGRLQVAQSGLLDLREVLNADQSSPLYHENDRIGVFYAESWALVHMLKFSEAYSPRFDRLLDVIGSGVASDRALQDVYGKTVGQIQMDLQIYVHGNRFREGVIHAKLAKSDAEPRLVTADPLDVAVVLAGIEARGPNRQEGLKTLDELVRANPNKLAPLETLALSQLAGPEPQAAVVPFLRALEAGTRDASLCYQFAIKLRTLIPDTDYVAALRRATEIDPDFSAAQQQLAAHAFNARDYTEAVKRFHLVKKLDRPQAFKYYQALSFAAYQIGDMGEAKSAAVRAREYAVAPEDKQVADLMVQYLNSGKPPAKAPGLSENPPQQR